MKALLGWLIVIVGSFVTLGSIVFVAPLVGVLVGAFSGWVVGLFFGHTFLHIFAALGITGVKMYQMGAFLGFVGGFFKNSSSSSQ